MLTVWRAVLRSQTGHPFGWILCSVALGLGALPLIIGVGPVDGLTLNSDFSAVLPSTSQSVRDMQTLQERFGGQQAMIVTVEAAEVETARAFVRRYAPRVEAMERHRVVDVDWNIADFESFVEEHWYLYADQAALEETRDLLRERLAYEQARANPFFIDLEDEAPPDPEEALSRMRERARQGHRGMRHRFPEGFLQHPSEPVLVMVVHTRIAAGDADATESLLAALDRAAAEAGSEGVQLRYGGTLVEALEETRALIAATRSATAVTLLLVMLAVMFFFRRARALVLLGLTLAPPLLLTFAFAELTVDYLNASSAFLSSIIVGNGINPAVIWLSRYFEERRAGVGPEAAVELTHRVTWKGTLLASLAAGVAYAALVFTDYRGFRDFGIVGGAGMAFCWLSAYGLLPALTVVAERLRPLRFAPSGRAEHGRTWTMASRGVVVGTTCLLTAVSLAAIAWAVARDPFEHDYRELRSERESGGDIEAVLNVARATLTDTLSGSALAVLTPSHDDALADRRTLEERADLGAYDRIRTVDDLLPSEAGARWRRTRVAEIRADMLSIRARADEEVQRSIDARLPPTSWREIRPEELPRGVSRPFTERDGTRGRLVFVEPARGSSGWDGRYTARWVAAARSVLDERGDPYPVAGSAVVLADIDEVLWRDGPKAVVIALGCTVLLLLLGFARLRSSVWALATLLLGVLWMAGGMALFGLRLNFLNFVSFPITFGNGADYGVNIIRRFEAQREGGQSVEHAVERSVRGTGMAVLLCSVTTIIGYLSLYTSSNRALNSFGAAMAISELTCMAAALLVLPWLMARRERVRQAPVDGRGRVRVTTR